EPSYLTHHRRCRSDRGSGAEHLDPMGWTQRRLSNAGLGIVTGLITAHRVTLAKLLLATMLMVVGGVWLVTRAFEEKIVDKGGGEMSPGDAEFSRVIRLLLGLFLLGIACRYVMQMPY